MNRQKGVIEKMCSSDGFIHRLGSFVQANAQRLLLLLGLGLLVLCAAINSVKLDADLASWIQRTSRVESELQAVESVIGEGGGTNSLLVLQALKQHQNQRHQKRSQQQQVAEILSVDSLMIHLETLAIATHVTVDLFDVSWSLKDLCFSPTLPDFEDMLVNKMLDKLMPCAIKTPLDCFWEGSKLLGPEQEVRLSSIGPRLRWTNLNPLQMIEDKRSDQPHATFPYEALISWMKRAGINSGYMNRPCLDPSDPNCPTSAPNKLSGVPPNVGAELTNGCRGLAARQMHWLEEELVGGVERNRSGFILRAEALQSTIQLMSERDIYEYWHNDVRVQNIHNWSTDKAKMVLDTWQQRFKDELSQFTKTSVASSPFKIQALTPKSMLEPINASSILDLSVFKLTVALYTLAICIMFPRFQTFSPSEPTDENIMNQSSGQTQEVPAKQTSRFKLISVAILISAVVVLTFVASLGLSSFMNLPFNMITTQIFPPLALYHGFRQALMIASTYAKHAHRIAPPELTTECLNELLPLILFESIILTLPFVVASALPVRATQVFCFQSLTHIVLSSATSILLVPAVLTTVLMRDSKCGMDQNEANDRTIYITYKTKNQGSRQSSGSNSLSIKAKKSIRCKTTSEEPNIEDLIFSRLQEDLRNIRADQQEQSTNIDFSAQIKLTSSNRSRGGQSNQRQPNTQTMSNVMSSYEPFPNHKQHLQDEQPDEDLPDLLRWSADKVHPQTADTGDCARDCIKTEPVHHKKSSLLTLLDLYSNLLVSSKWAQMFVCLFSLFMLIVIMPQSAKVKCGMQIRDIVKRGSIDYDSLMMREKYFPVYNAYIVTQDSFDYEANQRLLYELHRQMAEVEGVIRSSQELSTDKHHSPDSAQSKFWLSSFRDWLLDLQENFDAERNRSAISKEGWTPGASERAKLAYKLLAQTGRIDNPIDKNLVEVNRLVDKNGIINQRAFYYYLTAWVMKDSFTYSNSEANFHPEPKTWNEEAENLRIERAKKLNYAQIPFLMKLPEDGDSLRTVTDLRDISQAFTQLGLSNFPTGVPFIFWDQFINLNLLFVCTFTLLTLTYISISYLILGNMSLSLILILPSLKSVAELYSLLGFFAFQFNTAVAVILIGLMATLITQTTQNIMNFNNEFTDLPERIKRTLRSGFRTNLTNLILLLIAALIFASSKLDFMIKYSNLYLCLTAMNCFNSLVLTPVLLVLFAPGSHELSEQLDKDDSRLTIVTESPNVKRDTSGIVKHRNEKMKVQTKRDKRRQLTRVQSDISLSTISEEP